MINQTDAIRNFLLIKTVPDLANLYNHDMEVQVIVDEKNGQRVDSEYKGKQFQTYTDGINNWKPIRIPYKANSEPEYTDKPMTYDLDKYALGIGMTGWDWKNKKSRWVAFDFDAITDHSVSHNKRLSQEELQKIINLVHHTPWITVRKSTGGNGLHLYVFINNEDSNDLIVNNHNEHAALARSILNQLSVICSYDFSSRVDIAGGNIWIYHRKWELNNKIGLQLIKAGIPLAQNLIPPDWKLHLPVIIGKRTQTLPPDYEDDNDRTKLFDQLTGQKVRISLDKNHQDLINWLCENRHYASWDSDRWMLTTHTHALKQAFHSSDLKIKGKFETIAEGSEHGDRNCFACPLANGGWIVRRFTPGVSESETWEIDNKNWTWCYYNTDLNLHITSKLHKGMEDEKGKYNFNDIQDGIKAAKDLGVIIELPNSFLGRKMILKENQSKLIVEIDRHKDLDKTLEGWIEKPKTWLKVYKIKTDVPINDNADYDDIIRHLVSEDGKDLGWVMSSEKSWNSEPFLHIKTVLEGHYNYLEKKTKNILGSNIIKPWTMVNIPFGPEYPGARTWNRDAARLRFIPNPNLDNLHYPTWLNLLNHCGSSLDSTISNLQWGKDNGVKTGSDYLMCWIASLLKQPLIHLPYLFFYGPQESGKSSFHEALSRLFTRGYMRVENALRMNGNFNAEIKDAVLNIVEEIDFRKDKTAANRIKDWTTAEQLPIHEKHKTPYLVRNIGHYCQFSNDKEACPIYPGDTRITMIYVGPLDKQIPKNELMLQLEKEAPDFLAKIKNLELPRVTGRLGIPIIITEDKKSIETLNKDSFEAFLEEKCYYSPGEYVSYRDLFERFKEYLPSQEVSLWTINKIGSKLPPQYPKGRIKGRSDPGWCIGNISFNFNPNNPKTHEFVHKNDDQYLHLLERLNNNVAQKVST